MLKFCIPSGPGNSGGMGGIKTVGLCSSECQQRRSQLCNSRFHSHFRLVWGNHVSASCWVSTSWRVRHICKFRYWWTEQKRGNKGLLTTIPLSNPNPWSHNTWVYVLVLLLTTCVTLGTPQTLYASVSSWGTVPTLIGYYEN